VSSQVLEVPGVLEVPDVLVPGMPEVLVLEVPGRRVPASLIIVPRRRRRA
jgi:hypothetical protein